MIAGVGPIDEVIGVHHRPGLGSFDSVFNAGQVNLSQGVFIHDVVDELPAKCLIVHCVVLDGCANTLALNAIDMAFSDLARQLGIFRKIFKISSTQRRAFDINTRT